MAGLSRLIGSAAAQATVLLQRLEIGPGKRHVPDAEGLDLDRRLRLGDLPAMADAIVEAADELRLVAEAYYAACGDGGVAARLRPLQERRRARVCTRD